MLYVPSVQALIDELERLPGIGPKSAQRIAYYLLIINKDDANRLAKSIRDVKERVRFCVRCFNISEDELCQICSDPSRESGTICVVEEPRDVVAIERTKLFKGSYHVLGGALSPLDGIGPDQIKIKELLERVKNETIQEVIVSTNPNLEGEATSMYLAKLLSPLEVSVTRIASGLPVGGDLEYADEITLGRAIEGRRRID